MRLPNWFPLLGVLVAASAQAQGSSSVITLVMNPPGGEGYSTLQSGGMFADGAVSTYYNPALLADLERQTGAQLHYTRSNQDLLPILGLSDLYQVFWGVAAVAPDIKGGTDLGVGFFRNRVNFGRSHLTDRDGQIIHSFDSYETVYGAGIGVRLGLPMSLGGSVKFFDSHLSESLTSASEHIDGTARSWAFDIGALANPRLTLSATLGWPYLEAMPSVGVALANLGPDVFYVDPMQADPIPTTLTVGAGLQLRLAEFFEFTAAYSEEREAHRRSNWSTDPVVISGYSVSAGFYRYSEGWLMDAPGRRDERHIGHTLEFDMLRFFRFFYRMKTGDFRSPPRSVEGGFPYASITVLGLPYRASPRVSLGKRRIESRDRGIREGQEAFFLNLSI